LDSRLEIAIAVAQELEVAGPDVVAGILKSKSEVVDLIPEFSPSSFRLILNNESAWSSLETWIGAQDLGELGLIVKPAMAAGAFGVVSIPKAPTSSMVEAIRKHITSTHLPVHLENGEWLVQAKVDGRLVSIEGYFSNGVANFLGVTGRQKVGQT